MLKVEENHSCKSYWRGDGLYDMVRDKSRKVKLFGLTVWHYTESYKCDLLDELKNTMGFKK
jgi:hypothetical protein